MKKSDKKNNLFESFANAATKFTGSSPAFLGATSIVLLWAFTGPIFDYSETWQLVINTGTTIITFLMVFLIQSTQNRDSEALQLKLDELIRAASGAHNALLNLEELEQGELDKIRERYVRLAEEARQQLDMLGDDEEHPAVDQRKSTEGEAS